MTVLNLHQLFERMLEEMGPQGWWPAETKEEIILGAILVQNTAWDNVERSLANIQTLTAFQPDKILNLDTATLIELIRPSGFYKNKSKAILEIFQWLSHHNFDFDQIKQRYGSDLRKELLSLHGVGEETADVLLLYVFDEPVFIADKYAQKLFISLGQPAINNYRQLKKRVYQFHEFTLEEAQEFHGLIDEFGKVYLKKEQDFSKSFLADHTLKLD
ncbi:endonuclease III domain-containing protein [Amphibacillus sp. Q70]|uniref:endonuclease III domain-containing protein n=1 Tax=Amphibacillus sp. Q70 TaxID=3453416 RepID=UPI003F82A2D4